jgi:uncharacterized protein (TIGR02001 family)
MKYARILLTVTLAVTGGVANAQFSSTVTAVSDYEFRGVSATGENPALQASLDYSFSNGIAIGAWASNVDYGDDYDGNFELDLYASYSREISESASWSAGLTVYNYPDSRARVATSTHDARLKIEPYVEGYVGFTAGSFRAAQWYTADYSGFGVGAQYTEINYSRELPRGFSLDAHVGYSWGDYWADDSLGGGELADYSLRLSFEAGRFTLAGKLTATDADGERKVTSGTFANDARFIVSIETTFPWSAKTD